MKLKMTRILMAIVVFFTGAVFAERVQAATYKVLVVMSYDETYPWVQEIKEGIDSVLGADCELRYFYMDTKKNLEGGAQKAKEAFALYQSFQPDGVITADDNAQSMFVVPYLRDKVKTPVMFCGVNAEAAKYGFPASNVSGILERHHFRESIALAQNLIPTARTAGYMEKFSPSAQESIEQFQSEVTTYPIRFVGFKMPKNLAEAMEMAKDLSKDSDILVTETMHGLPDTEGKQLVDKDVIPLIVKAFGKPVIGSNKYHVENGVLCSVSKIGQEQGGTAATMLLEAMKGKPVSDIPVTRNKKGKAVINITVLRELGIKPRPMALKGAELIQTEK